jgi:hypothetical protein
MGYVALALATIVVGLAVHLHGSALGNATRDVVGDALWAMMITWWIGAIVPHTPLFGRAALSYGICVAVELSQLYHSPSLDALRATFVGHLVLGSGFDPRDLAAYILGVGASVLLESAMRTHHRVTS